LGVNGAERATGGSARSSKAAAGGSLRAVGAKQVARVTKRKAGRQRPGRQNPSQPGRPATGGRPWLRKRVFIGGEKNGVFIGGEENWVDR